MKWPQYYWWLAGNCKRSRAGVVATQDGGWETLAIGVDSTAALGQVKRGPLRSRPPCGSQRSDALGNVVHLASPGSESSARHKGVMVDKTHSSHRFGSAIMVEFFQGHSISSTSGIFLSAVNSSPDKGLE